MYKIRRFDSDEESSDASRGTDSCHSDVSDDQSSEGRHAPTVTQQSLMMTMLVTQRQSTV